MNTLKIAITFIGLIFLLPTFAQEKGDLGLIVSKSLSNKINYSLEYRKPLKEKFQLRMAFTYSNFLYSNHGFTKSVLATDTTIVQRHQLRIDNNYAVRFGAERQLGNSVFSVGADVSLGYSKRWASYQNSFLYLEKNGTWRPVYINYFDEDMTETSVITQNFLVPGARLSLSMDLPISKSLSFNMTAGSSVNAPIYMGSNYSIDPYSEFSGTENRGLEFGMSAGIGLRYSIGSRSKD